MATLPDLEPLGYVVEPAMFVDDPGEPTVYAVTGYGLMTYVTDGDTAAVQALADSDVQALAQLAPAALQAQAAALTITGQVRGALIAAIHDHNLRAAAGMA